MIRKATAEDAEAVWQVRNQAILHQCRGYYAEKDLEVWTPGHLPTSFIPVIAECFYLIELNDEIACTGMVNLETQELEGLFVNPKYQRNGLGSKMIQFLEQRALDASLTSLWLQSTVNAMPFYKANGYTNDGKSKYQSPRGIILDCFDMSKRLVV